MVVNMLIMTLLRTAMVKFVDLFEININTD